MPSRKDSSSVFFFSYAREEAPWFIHCEQPIAKTIQVNESSPWGRALHHRSICWTLLKLVSSLFQIFGCSQSTLSEQHRSNSEQKCMVYIFKLNLKKDYFLFQFLYYYFIKVQCSLVYRGDCVLKITCHRLAVLLKGCRFHNTYSKPSVEVVTYNHKLKPRKQWSAETLILKCNSVSEMKEAEDEAASLQNQRVQPQPAKGVWRNNCFDKSA